MKRILVLTFYYEPDLSAGSFRNTTLTKLLSEKLLNSAKIDVITTLPNRYGSFKKDAKRTEKINNITIYRVKLPKHRGGFLDQIISFSIFFCKAIFLSGKNNYNLIYASSGRLFTAFLASLIARKQRTKLYLDIRDIFYDTILDVLNNKFIKFFLGKFIRIVEVITFSRADHINLISEGFKEYFKKFKNPTFSFYTNGIDNIFLSYTKENTINNNPKIITYAGNIGKSQGLEKVIPYAAKSLGEKYIFKVIGDGMSRSILEKKIKDLKINNVKILNPVERNQLTKIYSQSDYTFIHLNNYNAFLKVLPSKLFELGSFDKTIIAGVSGYSRNFIKKYLPDSIIFAPGDYKTFVNKLLNHSTSTKTKDRKEFIRLFNRDDINQKMTNSIIKYLQ